MKPQFKKIIRCVSIFLVIILIAIGFYVYLISNNKTKKNSPAVEKTANVILKVENASNLQNVPNLTQEQIYKDPFVTQIRVALNGYLDGSNNGVEDSQTISGVGVSGNGLDCGLANFDKSYYKSKFIVWSSEPNKYGGMATDIVFLDKPDVIFWAWVYQLGGDGGKYVLRGFCKDGPADDIKAGFPEMIKGMLKGGEFPYSL